MLGNAPPTWTHFASTWQQQGLTAIRVTCRALLPCTRGAAARSAAVLPNTFGSRQTRGEVMASTIACRALRAGPGREGKAQIRGSASSWHSEVRVGVSTFLYNIFFFMDPFRNVTHSAFHLQTFRRHHSVLSKHMALIHSQQQRPEKPLPRPETPTYLQSMVKSSSAGS